jgi:hypothetical protein
MRLGALAAVVVILVGCVSPLPSPPNEAPASDRSNEIVLSASLTRDDHQTYRELPFTVPPGVQRMTVVLNYSGRDKKTVVDLGVRDPQGVRGWSGGAKQTIEIAETFATPSYRAGPLTPGRWSVILGIPNIRERETSEVVVRIGFHSAAQTDAKQRNSDDSTEEKGRWRRGDLHMHTGHSDGSCANVHGLRIPCPVHKTVEAAAAAKLDFIAITDHNTLSQGPFISELQPAFPDLLIVPGMEITTFFGHANALGLQAPIPFQLGHQGLRDIGALLDATENQGALLSINHPRQPSGEACMGCGWTLESTPWTRVSAIEVVNGGSLRLGGAEGAMSGIPFWTALLEEGHRVTAIGGSDNHDPTDTLGLKQSPVGVPTTYVWMNSLTQRGLLEGITSGRVFIDLKPGHEKALSLTVSGTFGRSEMGQEAILAPGETAVAAATFEVMETGQAEFISGGLDMTVTEGIANTARISLKGGAARGWIRVNIRSADGDLILIGNPIYITEKSN